MNRYILYWTNTELFYVTDDDSSEMELNKRMDFFRHNPGVIGATVCYDNPPLFAICADIDGDV